MVDVKLSRSRDAPAANPALLSAGQASLTRLGWSTSKNAEVKLPPLTQDAVAYIAQNPIDRSEYAIATFERSVYLSNDAGKTWRRIADRGRGS